MSNIKVIENQATARIILSKPPLNILDTEDLQELSNLLRSLRTGLITIESDQKVFSAGVNISDHSKEKVSEMLQAFHEVFYEMLDLEIPTISIVRSGCIGGGCELALFSDFVLASKNACFSQPEIKLGCFPPVSMVYFPYIIGNKQALEVILTGNKIFADDALRYGLVNKVFSEEEFDIEANKFINSLINNDINAIKTTIKAYKKLNYNELKEKIKLSEKIYLEEVNHDSIGLKK